MKKALVSNSADESQVKGAAKKEELRRQDELNDLRDVLKLAPGRRLFTRLLNASKLGKTAVKENPYRSYFEQGQQSMGEFIKNEILEADFDLYLLMLKEENEEIENE